MADVPAQAVLNEATLKRFDPYVKEIIDTAKYVALYKFDPEVNQWKKTDVEGCLFVYSRTGQPFHNIVVLNRLSKDNLVEPITKGLDLQLQEPFLLYRNTKLTIFGIWFYEKQECTRLATLIEDLMKKAGCNSSMSKNNHGASSGGAETNTNGGSVNDICSMLNRAQKAYNQGLTLNIREKLSPQESDQTPKSVMEFFAKASDKGKRLMICPPPVAEPKEKLNPIIHQLMSNPVLTVEHIEKQQRTVTPQAVENNSVNKFFQPLSSNSQNVKQDTAQLSPNSDELLENGLKCNNFSRIVIPILQNYTEARTEVRNLSSPHVNAAVDQQQPALMPPAMFVPSTNISDNTSNNVSKPEPLTKNQLLQAINYLLKNDPDFMTKIHEAYVKSLMEMVL